MFGHLTDDITAKKKLQEYHSTFVKSKLIFYGKDSIINIGQPVYIISFINK